MSTLAHLVVALVSVVGGGAAATVASRRGRVGPGAVLAAVGTAATVGALAAVVLVARSGFLAAFDLVHLLYLGVTVTGPLLAIGLGVLARRRSAPRWVWAVVAVALLPAPFGFYATHVEPTWLRVDHHAVAVDPARAGDDEVRIAVLADLQTPSVGDHERSAVAEVMAAEPDVILLPGDLFQGPDSRLEEGVAEIHDLLDGLEAPGGVFFVRGDADGHHAGPAARILEGTGIVTLIDETTEITVGDRTLRIGGTALDYASGGADAVRADLQDVPDDGAITVLVSHRPDTALALPAGSRVDLTVAGHTHGGQIVIPGFGPPVTFSDIPRDVARGGLHRIDGNQIYVSPGVGLERGPAPQVRFLSRPAVAVLTLSDR